MLIGDFLMLLKKKKKKTKTPKLDIPGVPEAWVGLCHLVVAEVLCKLGLSYARPPRCAHLKQRLAPKLSHPG